MSHVITQSCIKCSLTPIICWSMHKLRQDISGGRSHIAHWHPDSTIKVFLNLAPKSTTFFNSTPFLKFWETLKFHNSGKNTKIHKFICYLSGSAPNRNKYLYIDSHNFIVLSLNGTKAHSNLQFPFPEWPEGSFQSSDTNVRIPGIVVIRGKGKKALSG